MPYSIQLLSKRSLNEASTPKHESWLIPPFILPDSYMDLEQSTQQPSYMLLVQVQTNLKHEDQW